MTLIDDAGTRVLMEMLHQDELDWNDLQPFMRVDYAQRASALAKAALSVVRDSESLNQSYAELNSEQSRHSDINDYLEEFVENQKPVADNDDEIVEFDFENARPNPYVNMSAIDFDAADIQSRIAEMEDVPVEDWERDSDE